MRAEIPLIPEALYILLQFYAWLGIVAGLTRFHKGISTTAQRGWFISWPLLGIVYGQYSAGKYYDTSRQAVQILANAEGSHHYWNGRHGSKVVMPRLVLWSFGAATIGGVVAMVQQYLLFIEC
jgi:hypothetical protein